MEGARSHLSRHCRCNGKPVGKTRPSPAGGSMTPLTYIASGRYSEPTTPHCVVGFGRPVHKAHNRALCGFFVRAVQIFRVMAGLDGESFGTASSLCWSTNPVQSRLHLLGRSGDGFKSLHKESASCTHKPRLRPQHRFTPSAHSQPQQATSTIQSFLWSACSLMFSQLRTPPGKPASNSPATLLSSMPMSVGRFATSEVRHA